MLRLGELLVDMGAMRPEQRDTVLERQRDSARPFGVLAEELFGVDPGVVEDAWAQQYTVIAPRLDPRRIEPDPDLLALVTRRQAWQFGLVPVWADDRAMVGVTSAPFLARAMRFVGWRLEHDVSFALCTPEQLVEGLERHYPIDGFGSGMLDRLIGDADAA